MSHKEALMAKEKNNTLSYGARALGISIGILLGTILSTVFGWEENTVLSFVIKFLFAFILYFPVSLLFDRIGEKLNRKNEKK